jgi:hypothetical protein|tara:strand:+ start:1552 stop:1671 length:120 start_codon:yes stop_codon:yes gene_type:complete
MALVILLAVFASSIPLIFVVLMLRMWNRETPTLKREKKG